MDYYNPHEMRSGLEGVETFLVDCLPPLHSSLEEYQISIPARDGATNKATVVRPKSKSTKGRPLIVLFHGGAFTAGSTRMVTRPARDFAKEFDAVVVSPSYRLSPEHKFPAQFDDSIDAVQWLSRPETLQELHVDLAAGFVIGGQSAGGSLSATILQYMQDQKMQPAPTGAYVCIPLLLSRDIVPPEYKDDWKSMEEQADKHPLLTEEGLADLVGAMQADVRSPKFSPFSSPTPHVGLPRVYVQVGQSDSMRDDGIIYAKALQKAGVEVRLDNFQELGHEAWSIFTNEDSPKSLAIKSLAAMKWLLRRD